MKPSFQGAGEYILPSHNLLFKCWWLYSTLSLWERERVKKKIPCRESWLHLLQEFFNLLTSLSHALSPMIKSPVICHPQMYMLVYIFVPVDVWWPFIIYQLPCPFEWGWFKHMVMYSWSFYLPVYSVHIIFPLSTF